MKIYTDVAPGGDQVTRRYVTIPVPELDAQVDPAAMLAAEAARLRSEQQLAVGAMAADAAETVHVARVMGLLEDPEPEPTDRATLTMPILTLRDVDGETIIAEAVVEVTLDRDGILDDLATSSCGVVDRGLRATVRRRLTDDGATAIRSLALLLQDGDQ